MTRLSESTNAYFYFIQAGEFFAGLFEYRFENNE